LHTIHTDRHPIHPRGYLSRLLRHILLLLVGILAAAGGPGRLHGCDGREEREIPRIAAGASTVADAAMRAPSACECARAVSRQSDGGRAAALACDTPHHRCSLALRGARISELRVRLTSGGLDASHLGTPPPHK
jgi:hypothetical protein